MPKAREEKEKGPNDRLTFKRILVAVDGSAYADRAAKVAAELALRCGAELFVLHVVSGPAYSYAGMFSTVSPPPQRVYDQYERHLKEVAKGYVDRAVSEAEKRGVKATGIVEAGVSSVVEAIATHADDMKVDLLVVGTRGLGSFKKLLIGSVSSGVVAHAKCPVLVVR